MTLLDGTGDRGWAAGHVADEGQSEHSVRLLVVEDDPLSRELLVNSLRAYGYEVETVDSTRSARARLAVGAIDLVLLDVSLPGESGLALSADLRDSLRIPVIVVSGSEGLSERIAAFEAGADDFVPKPFHVSELAARVEAVLRRTGRRSRSGVVTGPRGMVLNVMAGEVGLGEARVRLTRSEVVLLRVLLESAGEAVSSEALSREVWDYADAGDVNFIQQHVSRLRRKLKQIGIDDLIETVYGGGYRVPLPGAGGGSDSTTSLDRAAPSVG